GRPGGAPARALPVGGEYPGRALIASARLDAPWDRRFDCAVRPGLAVICVFLATVPAAHALCTANASPQVACKIKTTKKPKVRITRDGYGVPHVKARSLYDVGYGMGQAQAQDRLFQMELVRKSATGNGTIPSGVRYTVESFGSTEVYKPDKWRTTDVAAIGVLLAGRFGSGGGRQLRQAALLNYLAAKLGDATAARQVFEDVRWVSD